MASGAFAPMPIRLGGSPTEGWLAEQHARLAADLVASLRSAPLAILTVTTGGVTAVLTDYQGQNGVGSAHAPVAAHVTTGTVSLTWLKSYRSPLWRKGVNELEHSWRIVAAQAFVNSANVRKATATVNADGTVTVRHFNGAALANGGASSSVVVKVYGTWIPEPKIGTYGGDLDKRNNESEHPTPYAAAWYRQIQADRGTAYTKRTGTFVHAENLAMARFWGYHASRLPEKMRANSQPARSDERLPYWQSVLGVPSLPGEEKWQLRQRCAAAYIASNGPTFDNVDAALRKLLGTIYVGLRLSNTNALSSPPDPTLWPGINPGPSSYSVGGGCWLSTRAHIGVSVQQPADLSDGAFQQLMNLDVHALLDGMLPAWVTWDWFVNGDVGFLLDVSELDFDRI